MKSEGGLIMSAALREVNEYAELYAKKHHCTIEQAKETVIVKSFEILHKETKDKKGEK